MVIALRMTVLLGSLGKLGKLSILGQYPERELDPAIQDDMQTGIILPEIDELDRIDPRENVCEIVRMRTEHRVVIIMCFDNVIVLALRLGGSNPSLPETAESPARNIYLEYPIVVAGNDIIAITFSIVHILHHSLDFFLGYERHEFTPVGTSLFCRNSIHVYTSYGNTLCTYLNLSGILDLVYIS